MTSTTSSASAGVSVLFKYPIAVPPLIVGLTTVTVDVHIAELPLPSSTVKTIILDPISVQSKVL